MHLENKKPVRPDLSQLLEQLSKAGIKFILVGGLAAVVQGAPITTMDVDIVHERSQENISRLFSLLKSMSAYYRRPDDKIIEPKREDFSEMGHILLTTCSGPVDVLSFIEGGQVYEDLLEHTHSIEFRGNEIRVLDLGKIIELKKESNNPKDKQRLPVLEETIRQIEKESGCDPYC